MSAPTSTGTTAPSTRPTPRPAPAWRAVLAQTGMELRLLLRSGESLLVTFGIPLGILVFFSAVDVLPTGTDDPVDFLVPGVLAISVMSTGFVAVAIQTAFERKYGVLKRLGGTPLTRGGFLAAKSLAVAALVTVQTLLVLGIASLGLGFSLFDGCLSAYGAVPCADPVEVLGAMVLGTFTFTSLGLWMAGTLRAELTLALSNAVFLVLLMVSGLTIELAELPGPMADLAPLLPSGALGTLLRDGLGTAWVADPGFAWLVLAAWGVVAAAATARRFRWDG